MYNTIQRAGFILVFREHRSDLLSHKKGNVDTDIVFLIMKKLYLREKFDKVFLVSGDGDYYQMVEFLRDENKLGKVLFPTKSKASSLYRQIEAKYRDYLDASDIKKKIALQEN